jgi:hypothetical protein
MDVLDEPGVPMATVGNAVYRWRVAHMSISLRRLAVLACFVGALPPGPVQAQDETVPAGVQWETTSQVSMEGMPFGPPPTKTKVCAAAGATEPPGSANEERGCVNSDFMQDGLKVTWNSACAGPPQMTGHGEITYADEAQSSYTGTIQYATEKGNVGIQLTGQRVGTCDKPR